MKTPDQFKIKDWQTYLFSAVRREYDPAWKPKSHMVAAWTRVLKNLTQSKEYDTLDPFVLALALDVIALEWGNVAVTSPWEILAPGKLFYRFSGRSKAFWRAVWFSRYAATEGEVQYYRYWITQYEAGLGMERGEPGRLDLLVRSKRALKTAEEAIRDRGRPRPLFRLHWLAQRFGDD